MSIGPVGPHTSHFPERFTIPEIKRPPAGPGNIITVPGPRSGGNVITNSGDVENHTRRIAGKLRLVMNKLNQV